MTGRNSARIVAAGLAVAAHAVVLGTILRYGGYAFPVAKEREIPMVLMPLLQRPEKPTAKKQPPGSAVRMRTIGTSPTAIPLPDQSGAEGLRALGQFLSCDAGNESQWSDEQRRACAKILGSRAPGEAEPLLGPANPSPFDAVIAERNAPARRVFNPCPETIPNRNLGTAVCLEPDADPTKLLGGAR